MNALSQTAGQSAALTPVGQKRPAMVQLKPSMARTPPSLLGPTDPCAATLVSYRTRPLPTQASSMLLGSSRSVSKIAIGMVSAQEWLSTATGTGMEGR
jgi:hypothetical protein